MVKFDLKFDIPITELIWGVFIGIVLMFVLNFFIDPLSLVVGLIVGGFITTYYSKEKKVRYGFYTGLIVLLLFMSIMVIIGGISAYNINFFVIVSDLIVFAGFATLGGLIARVINDVQKHKTELQPPI